MNRKIIFVILVLIIAAGAFLLWPQESERLDIRPDTRLYGWRTEEKKLFIHVINVGGIKAEVSTIELLGWGNYTFYRDIIIPPQVDCTIEFSMWGGPVSLTTVSGSPPAEGGQIASPTWSGNMTSGTYITVILYTRSGKAFTLDHVEVR